MLSTKILATSWWSIEQPHIIPQGVGGNQTGAKVRENIGRKFLKWPEMDAIIAGSVDDDC